MKILVANLGSTSFKYRLLDMANEELLARGGVERIGKPESACFVEIGQSRREFTTAAPDHAAAVRLCLEQLSDPDHGCIGSPAEISAIGFKAVHAKGATGAQRVNEELLQAMEAYNAIAPAHNPPYVQAMRLLASELTEIPLVAAFETGFHESIAPAQKLYAVPMEWSTEHGIRRWGFHGASHCYIAGRASKILGNPSAKIISCHLGGSSSLCAIEAGKSRATTMGMSPQSGLPNNNRCGDFDPFAIPVLMQATGKSMEQILDDLANRSGLLGISGISNDIRDIQAKAGTDERAQLALDVLVSSIRHYIGAYLVLLGGADAIVFTAGIGEGSAAIRAAVCADLQWHGIELDAEKNAQAEGEAALHSDNSRVQIWTIPTNEEVVVARQVQALLA